MVSTNTNYSDYLTTLNQFISEMGSAEEEHEEDQIPDADNLFD